MISSHLRSTYCKANIKEIIPPPMKIPPHCVSLSLDSSLYICSWRKHNYHMLFEAINNFRCKVVLLVKKNKHVENSPTILNNLLKELLPIVSCWVGPIIKMDQGQPCMSPSSITSSSSQYEEVRCLFFLLPTSTLSINISEFMHGYVYIHAYIYMCVCVCVYKLAIWRE